MASSGERYLRRVPGVWIYPWRFASSFAFMVLVPPVLALFRCLASLPWAETGFRAPKLEGYGWLLLLLVVAYGAFYSFEVLTVSSMGSDQAPALLPELGEELGRRLITFIGGYVAAFLLAGALIVYGVARQPALLESGFYLAAIGMAILLGILYLPIAFILVTFTEEVRHAFDIRLVVQGVRRLSPAYFLCCLFFAVWVGSTAVCEIAWIPRTPAGLNGGRYLAAWGTSAVQLYFMLCSMRALGVLYATHKDRLGWWR